MLEIASEGQSVSRFKATLLRFQALARAASQMQEKPGRVTAASQRPGVAGLLPCHRHGKFAFDEPAAPPGAGQLHMTSAPPPALRATSPSEGEEGAEPGNSLPSMGRVPSEARRVGCKTNPNAIALPKRGETTAPSPPCRARSSPARH